MKILLLTDGMDRGGAETHIAALARGLRRMGQEVTLLSAGGVLADELEKEGIPQLRMPWRRGFPFSLLLRRHALRRLIRHGGYRLVHAHARLPAFLLRGAVPRNVGVLVTAHADFYSSPLLRRLCYWGHHTVAVSEDLRLSLTEKFRLPPRRITVVRNGVDVERFSPPTAGERDTENGGLRILFASRMDKDCSLGAELLCVLAPALLRLCPGLEITLAGGGEELGRIRALAECANKALPYPVLRAVGWVEDMPALLRRHHIFVGVSRAAMEAAATGCAVVLCGNEGYLGLLDRDASPLAVATNLCGRGCPLPEAGRLYADLARLLTDRPFLECVAAWGRELILSRFDAAAMCREIYGLYCRYVGEEHTRTLTVGGYFGCGNLGDDAILSGFLEMMRLGAPSVRVQALTASPHKQRRRFGIPCYGRKNPLALVYALLRSDAFLLGGGSLLQDLTSRRSMRYYLFLLRLSRLLGVPAVLYAAGVGPLTGGEGDYRRLRRVLEGCSYVSLRDRDSHRLLLQLGVEPSLLHRGADLALLMPVPSREQGALLLLQQGIAPTGRLLGVVLRKGKENGYLLNNLLAAVKLVCRQRGWTPLFAVHDGGDLAVSREGARVCGGFCVCPREAGELLAILGQCHAAVTMRLHAMILCARAGVSVLGVPGDPRDTKIAAFAREVGYPTCLPEEDSVTELARALTDLVTSPPPSPAVLADSLADQRKKAWKDLANILGMLYNKGELSRNRRSSP